MRHRLNLVTGAAVVFLVGCSVGSPAETVNPTPEPLASPAAIVVTPSPRVRQTRAVQPSPEAPDGTRAEVTDVVDGDTIKVSVDGTVYTVRYIGIDTPETVHPSKPVEWMGKEASQANSDLVGGQTVVLVKDVSETDRYGRLLRYVYVQDADDWVFVNEWLVANGFAQSSSYPPDVAHQSLFVEAEQTARESALGLWGAQPTLEPTVEPTAKPTERHMADCHPSYDPCLPVVADLNCPDVRAMGLAPVTVIGPDEYRLDGNNDGVGCE